MIPSTMKMVQSMDLDYPDIRLVNRRDQARLTRRLDGYRDDHGRSR